MVESRVFLTSATFCSAASVRNVASATGTANFRTGTMSTTTRLGSPSLGSGYGSESARESPTTDFSPPVW